MPRRYEHYAHIPSLGTSIGYSVTERNGFLGVRFLGPGNKRLERMTGHRRRDENFHLEAVKVIAAAYLVSLPDSQVG